MLPPANEVSGEGHVFSRVCMSVYRMAPMWLLAHDAIGHSQVHIGPHGTHVQICSLGDPLLLPPPPTLVQLVSLHICRTISDPTPQAQAANLCHYVELRQLKFVSKFSRESLSGISDLRAPAIPLVTPHPPPPLPPGNWNSRQISTQCTYLSVQK